METIALQGAAHHEPHPLQHMSKFRSEQQRGKSCGSSTFTRAQQVTEGVPIEFLTNRADGPGNVCGAS